MNIETKVVADFDKLDSGMCIKDNSLLAGGIYPGLQDWLMFGNEC